MNLLDKITLPVTLGVISIGCPLIVAAAITFVHLSHTKFWASVSPAPEDEANHHAAAMMGAAEGITFVLAAFIGCVAGSLLGAISFLLQGKKRGVGFAGLVLNASPLVFFAFALIIAKL